MSKERCYLEEREKSSEKNSHDIVFTFTTLMHLSPEPLQIKTGEKDKLEKGERQR